MDISKQYDPAQVEEKWYQHWESSGYFHADTDDREPYTIVIPPPNVTGVLHMGHMLNNTIQDVLIRRARLMGYNACWVPGTDHASIATEAKVVAKLKAEGIQKADLSRDEFLAHAWEWTEKHGGIILQQLRKLGASCDWDRTAFTMDPERYESVIRVFVDLFEKGKVYRGYRMVNWDPEAKTTVSDEEVIYKELQGKLYFLQYPIVGEEGHVTIATTRPETILGDTAVCVNPEDERYRHLVGKKVRVPIANREIPVIADSYVDMEFGTGCLKITPAHDVNDKEIGERHRLEVIDILHEDGTLNAHGLHYAGMDRFAVRKAIALELEEKGYLVKAENYVNKVGTSERTGAVIEPRISKQWFLAMKDISQPALENVLNNNIQFFPAKFVNTYKYWMENVRDWCISRQLYWGHRIPAWYFGEGINDFVVAHHEAEALEKARAASGNPQLSLSDLQQDPDVLDTWFSSWLWPIAVFDGINKPDNNRDLDYFYPTQVLVTAPEILFFWVARMIIAGYEYKQEKPFEHVYLTGIVRDKQGRKMSKSLGNSPDPLDLIAQYSADGVRVGMLLSSPAGNDLLFDDKLCEQGRNFANKVWNAMRLVKGWQVAEGHNHDNDAALAWFEAKLNTTIADIDKGFTTYSLSEVLKTTYSFVWDDFCSWLLEMVKPEFGQPIDKATYDRVVGFFEQILTLLHPFMPFITEEIWHLLKDRPNGGDLIVATWPKAGAIDQQLLQQGEIAKEIISKVRDYRARQQMSPKEPVTLYIHSQNQGTYSAFQPLVAKLANLDGWHYNEQQPDNAFHLVVNKDNLYLSSLVEMDVESEREKIVKEIDYIRGFIGSVQKKLSNERFVAGAPAEVVDKERQKLADGEAKLQSLEEALSRLS